MIFKNLKKIFFYVTFFILIGFTFFYLINPDFLFLKKDNDGFFTFSNVLNFSYINNVLFVLSLIIIFILIFFLFEKKFLNQILSNKNFVNNLIILSLIVLLILLCLPYERPMIISNFGDVIHDSERIISIFAILEGSSFEVFLKDFLTVHGWFSDIFLSYIAYYFYGIENIIPGYRFINSIYQIIVVFAYILFLYSFINNFFLKNKKFIFIIFLSIVCFLKYLNITDIVDRELFVLLVASLYLNYQFDQKKLLRNDLIALTNAVLLFLCLFYNFYQFIALSLISLSILIIISFKNKTPRSLLIFLISLLILFFIFSYIFNFEIIKIAFLKIYELIFYGYSTALYDMRFGYRLGHGIFIFYIYISILSFILFFILKDFFYFKRKKNYSKRIWEYFVKNIKIFILLMISTVGFYEFLVRGSCCSMIYRTNLIHYHIFGYILLMSFYGKKI